ncbi:uncharacterized protein LOC126776826 [Nymphalis io]|uniref:uncharacterized protein LOC126776826 n=1 Tax=Inachis io TaxID=171585 RepID=UPI00216886A3|nr:uncharacterized protein LOC126776826 [Nymphalis io]XP_050355623.1 uncharacterized protein LOC126776826 [Nymphalis io]
MGFTRNWDSSCPRVWNAWQTDGTKWVIQDLAPEDDDTALEILVNHLLPDETLCNLSDFTEDAMSVESIVTYWKKCLSQRMSLGCYTDVDGKKTLVALNVCIVERIEDKFPTDEIKGAAWINVLKALEYVEAKCNSFEYLGVDELLYALGLVVKTEYRGHKLGSKILAAREPLCISQGLKVTSTVFTGPASQKSAARCGFETMVTVSLKEFAEQGLNYPPDEKRVVKVMYKRFD